MEQLDLEATKSYLGLDQLGQALQAINESLTGTLCIADSSQGNNFILWITWSTFSLNRKFLMLFLQVHAIEQAITSQILQ